MTNNNPPDVVVGLSREDAEMLLHDCQSAQRQLLALIHAETDARREYLEKLVGLLEFKKRVAKAVQGGLDA